MTVASGLASVQRISGGCFNPALGTALSVTHTFNDGGTIQYIWSVRFHLFLLQMSLERPCFCFTENRIYLVGPIIGAVVAGYSFYGVLIKSLSCDGMSVCVDGEYVAVQ